MLYGNNISLRKNLKSQYPREFPGGQMVRTQCFHCWVLNLIPGCGSRILQAKWCGEKKKKAPKQTKNEALTRRKSPWNRHMRQSIEFRPAVLN